MLVFSTVAGAMSSVNKSSESVINRSNNNYTHTILGECGTGVGCTFCKYAHAALKTIYAGGWHPFYYISLVSDRNTHADARADELGISGIPDVHFDGSYREVGGAGSVPTARAKYNASIVDCGNRVVSDIDINLDVIWNGDAEMFIEVSVDNNEASQYNGHIRVYVTEIESTMGWKDMWGFPYTFAFLDYAFNEDISISSGDSWDDSITWDGHNYNDGHGHNFGNIQYGNIMVVASVFNSGSGWVDDTAGFRIGDNTPPYTPNDPYPEDGATDVYYHADLKWTSGDPESDVVTYDIYFGTSNPPPKVVSNHLCRIYDPGPLNLNTLYYWQIMAWDCQGLSSTGPIWNFTTELIPDNPPLKPATPSGPIGGKVGVEHNYTSNTTDPDGHQVYYLFDWGDDTNSGWIGPYNSGENCTAKHIWKIRGSYEIRVKARDHKHAESEWSDPLVVTMPRNKVINTPFLNFLENHPNLLKLMQLLLQRLGL
jgi:hypothetical protein